MKHHYAAFQPTSDPSSERSWTNVRGYGSLVIQQQPTVISHDAQSAPTRTFTHPHALLQPLPHDESHLNAASISRHSPVPPHMQLPPCCVKHVQSNHHCTLIASRGKEP
jgi:hypothetical protein